MLCHICTVFCCEDALPALSCRGQCFAALQSIRCLNLASDTKTLPADSTPFLQRPLQQTHRVVPVSLADTTGCQKKRSGLTMADLSPYCAPVSPALPNSEMLFNTVTDGAYAAHRPLRAFSHSIMTCLSCNCQFDIFRLFSQLCSQRDEMR